MDWVEQVAEERIRQAQQRGAFTRSPYHGRRVRLEPENPHLPRAWWAAFHLLEINNFTPTWIWRRQQIEKAIAAWRAHLHRVAAFEATNAADATAARERLRSQLNEINRHIRDYNLSRPFGSPPLALLHWQEEWARAQG
ncbi:MAG: DUF1992 domain-containing protein [Chloroflexi bacterium]|nr:DUF1992 domain-containing protein [Chloroflexota bacterium]